MSFRSLEYAVVESLSAIKRNAFYSFASILTVALTLGVLGGFVLFALGLYNAAGSELNKFEISIWLDSTKSQDDIVHLKEKIGALDHVETVRFIPASETWQLIKKGFGNDTVMQGVDAKRVMPELDYFRVRLDDPRYTAPISAKLQKLPHVAKVIEGREIVEQVVHFADIMKWVGVGVAGALLLIAMFVTSNTIRLMIYARRREIRVMQLVGATNWFIRLPLVFEGTILGILGGCVACALVLGGSHYLSSWVLEQMPRLGQVCSGVQPLWVLGGLAALGWLIGAMASMISIQRFLKT